MAIAGRTQIEQLNNFIRGKEDGKSDTESEKCKKKNLSLLFIKEYRQTEPI